MFIKTLAKPTGFILLPAIAALALTSALTISKEAKFDLFVIADANNHAALGSQSYKLLVVTVSKLSKLRG